MTTLAIRGGTVVDQSGSRRADVLIGDDHRVAAVGEHPVLAVDEADGALRGARILEARVERDGARRLAQARDVDGELVLAAAHGR